MNKDLTMMRPEMEFLDLDAVSPADRYKLFMGAIVPRPIALVTSLSAKGTINAAPFSSFMSISAVNNLVGLSINERGNGETKDTVNNIRSRGEFVINTVCEDMAEQAQCCSRDLPNDVSEVAVAGLATLPSRCVATPRIAQSPISFECRLHSLIRFETADLVVGRVLAVQARAGLISEFKIPVEELAPLGRLAGRSYCKIGDRVHV